MDIVCATDDNYVEHCCTMLISLFKNNLFENHTIHLLTGGLSTKNREIIEQFVYSFQGQFRYYIIDSSFLISCPIKETDHLTIATYYRLFIAEILPNDLSKVLYLDCDMIINRSIQKLWETDICNYAIAAVEEMGASAVDVYERLGYDKQYGYFNAGVLLINLEFWRKHQMTQCFCNYIDKNAMKIRAHDQDVLNALFHDKCLLVSCKWNVEEAFYHYHIIKRNKLNSQLRVALRFPCILHYTWKPKPWEDTCKHPFRVNYFMYRNKTIWAQKISLQRWIRFLGDKYFFCFLLWAGIGGKRFYRLK